MRKREREGTDFEGREKTTISYARHCTVVAELAQLLLLLLLVAVELADSLSTNDERVEYGALEIDRGDTRRFTGQFFELTWLVYHEMNPT